MKRSNSKPDAVRVWEETLRLPTYEPAAPDKNPMFLEKRVYQGSSGRVYPLPFIDRIAERPTIRPWRAIGLENAYLEVLILPELGGRIHAIRDKTNGYDLIYRQTVIKPALVGLAGPWISGGIEFNWPQHHRPATFMPVDTEVERAADGSATVWCSDHDPMARMKGMHGVCLHPGRAAVELKVRVYNRTPFVQTFLWWANVATRVHEAYQSFFPPDVTYVADHARRSMSSYPLARGHYYGVDYAERGRTGVPPGEVPAQFIPPHCQPASRRASPGLRRGQDQSGSAHRPGNLPAYAPNDLSFYANIPVPTSYMCMGSREDFFGGYDYQAEAGIVHVANHHIAPGKKQWTWGNHAFGYAWDRNLTDPDQAGVSHPYIEIMAGVYTDNQPDFSFLQPGETKSWSQHWYPIQRIGPAHRANLDAAVSLGRTGGGRGGGRIRFGVSVTRAFPRAQMILTRRPPVPDGRSGADLDPTQGKPFARFTRDLAPGRPFVAELPLPKRIKETEIQLRVFAGDGAELIRYQPEPPRQGTVPPPATEPLPPEALTSADELFVTGLHLEQYRHATRCPTLYWREALRRDPLDARCNNALGRWHLRRGELTEAEACFRQAIKRLTHRNANPVDGEPYYHLGLCLRYQLDRVPPDAEVRGAKADRGAGSANQSGGTGARLFDEAYAAFYKATWNQAWAGASYHALAELDCRRQEWDQAAAHLERSAGTLDANQRAMNLWAMIVQRQGNVVAAEALPKLNRAADPLDWWARQLDDGEIACDMQTRLDLALDYARAGFIGEAIELLEQGLDPARNKSARRARGQGCSGPNDPRELGTAPMVHYCLGWLHTRLGNGEAARGEFALAAAASPDYCFPARLEEIAILETAMALDPRDARAPYYLGNLLYDRRRHAEAIALWERSARLDPRFSIVWRNLGIGYINIRRQPIKARAAYERAFRSNPRDARLLFERDQLWKRLGASPERRLRELNRHPELVGARDDLTVEQSALLNQTGHHEMAVRVITGRRFQPWEGGEGGPLGQYVRSHAALGRAALAKGDAAQARACFEAAMQPPASLGEARHLLANQSDLHYWLGCACAASGDLEQARTHWRAAATFRGDFQEMSVRVFSEMTYFSARAWERLGARTRARRLFLDLLAHARELRRAPARIDYFATSLPTMLLFEDDLQFRQETTASFLEAQARMGLGQTASALKLLRTVLERDPNHAAAADLAQEHEPRGALRSVRLRGVGPANQASPARTTLATSPSNSRVRRACPGLVSPARRSTRPVRASVVIE